MVVVDEGYRQDLMSLNRLDELLKPKGVDQIVKLAAITQSAVRKGRQPELLQEEIVQKMRIERIKLSQDEEQ